MERTMHFVWAGGALPPDGPETIFAWHVRHPEFTIVVWITAGASLEAARATFAAHPTIHVAECDGSVRPAADGSVRMGDGSVRGLFSAAVRGELLPAVRGAMASTVGGELLPAVRGELLPAVRGELLPAVRSEGLTLVETGMWGDGSVAPQGILNGLGRGASALIGLL